MSRLVDKERNRLVRGRNSAKNIGLGRSYTEHELKEYIRCANDPVYFIKTYVKITHPRLGRIPFKLWDFQERAVEEILGHAFNIILKPRQMGLSWLLAALIVWMMIFYTDKNILVISIKLGAAMRFLEKIKYIIMALPDFLQPEVVEASKMVMQLDNGSRVESIPTSEEAGRSEGVSWMIFDEAAFIRWMRKIWSAAFPTLSTGGMCTAVSTANGAGDNWFHTKWLSALNGSSGFNPLKLTWDMHPERGQRWYNRMKQEMGDMQFAQEVLCDFIMSGNPYFRPDVLAGIAQSDIMEPKFHEIDLDIGGRTGHVKVKVRVFRDPDPEAFYIISVDPCKGDGTSALGLHVFRIANDHVEQVAACSEKIPADITAYVAEELGYRYNTACIAVENNKGMVVLKILQDDLNYPDIYEMKKMVRADGVPDKKGELGFNTNSRTRPHILGQLEAAVRQETLIIRDVVTLNQMWNFAYAEGTLRPEALAGHCDDLVISAAIGYEVAAQFGFGIQQRSSLIMTSGSLGSSNKKLLLPPGSLKDSVPAGASKDTKIEKTGAVLI